jgi:molybdopterin converting factor small subunit
MTVPAAQVPDLAADRRALVETGVCDPAHPAVTVELYGSLRLKAARDAVPMRADTLATAVSIVKRVCPPLARLLPDGAALAENFRFSINGRTVTTELATLLAEGDRVLVFSASVGG